MIGSSTRILEITEYRLRLSRVLLPVETTQLRGFFGKLFADEILLHHHEANGELRYDYPRVQFKVLDREACLIGIAEGGAVVERLWRQVDEARIGDETLTVIEAGLQRRRERVGETEQFLAYCFLSPWMALNQANHRRFTSEVDEHERCALLERILVGNCLSLAKALGHCVMTRLHADARGLYSVTARLKGVPMLAFRGSFRTNFQLPNRLGIGKSVSRGFGTVQRREERATEKMSC
jgi:hypothetical protein